MISLLSLRRWVDRFWLQQKAAGFQSLRVRMLSITPMLVAIVAVDAFGLEQQSSLSWTIIVLGMLASLTLLAWILWRGMVSMGATSTSRSAQFIQRERASRDSVATAEAEINNG